MDLFENEAVFDDAGNAVAPEPAPAAEPTEPAAPAEPEAPAVEEPVYLTAEQAAEIADARLNALLSQYQEPTPAVEPGTPVDWNERLNPLDPNFGQNFIDLNMQRDEWLLGQVKTMLTEAVGPISKQAEEQARVSNETALDGVVAAELARTGAPETAAPIVKNLARSYFPALSARLGPNAGAAAAMAQAIKEVNALAAASKTAGGTDNAAHLNVLANANREPGTPGAAVSEPPAGTVTEALERWKSRNTSTLTAV